MPPSQPLRPSHALRDTLTPLELMCASLEHAALASDFSSQAWLADRPAASFELAELRRVVLERCGLDLGFDAGEEAFCAMLAARLLGRRDLAPALVHALCTRFEHNHWRRRYRFFVRQNGFAADTDCSSVALAASFQAGRLSRGELFAGVRELLGCVPEEHGRAPEALWPDVVLVYWDDGREPNAAPRGLKQDPAVAANVLYALFLAEEAGFADPRMERFAGANLAYVRESLAADSSVRTRYYPSRDTLLAFVAEVCARFPRARPWLELPLRRAVRARLEETAQAGDANALDVAMRLLAAQAVGLAPDALVRRLLSRQRLNGSLPCGAFFTLGRIPGLCFGSSALTTAIGAAALASHAERAR